MNNLAVSYDALGRHAEAVKLHEETLALMKAKLGPDHPDTLHSMNNLASSYDHAGRKGEALKLREETVALQRAKLGPDHPDTLIGMAALARGYAQLGRHADAIKLYEEVLDGTRRRDFVKPGDAISVTATKGLARSLWAVGRPKESAAYWLKARALAPKNTETVMWAAAACLSAGDAEGYAVVRRRALEAFEGTGDPRPPNGSPRRACSPRPRPTNCRGSSPSPTPP